MPTSVNKISDIFSATDIDNIEHLRFKPNMKRRCPTTYLARRPVDPRTSVAHATYHQVTVA
jgi:hypothetical protein